MEFSPQAIITIGREYGRKVEAAQGIGDGFRTGLVLAAAKCLKAQNSNVRLEIIKGLGQLFGYGAVLAWQHGFKITIADDYEPDSEMLWAEDVVALTAKVVDCLAHHRMLEAGAFLQLLMTIAAAQARRLDFQIYNAVINELTELEA
jgi:hypothetical protein